MIYIYDITVNLNDDLINFYDWEESDILTHIKKTLLIKVNNYFYKLLIKKSVLIDNSFLDLIKNKTEIHNNKKTEILKYGCIFSNGTDALMVSFNDKGKIIERSKFIIDEELEILEISNNITEKEIKYEIVKTNYKLNLLRRDEKKVLNLIIKELKIIKNDKEKIKYLYFEWFDKKSDNENIYDELIKNINLNFTEKHREFLKILNLITIEK